MIGAPDEELYVASMATLQRSLQQAFEQGRGYGRGRLLAEIEALPCYVARAGEGTYECRYDSLCPACALRLLVAQET